MIVPSANDYDVKHVITGVSGLRGFSAITIEKDRMNSEIGFIRRVLEVFEENNLSVEHVPSGIDTISVVLDTKALDGVRERLLTRIQRSAKPDSIAVEDGLALIAVVGRGMIKAMGTSARVFNAISAAGVNIKMIDQGSSELNIIVGVEERDFETALTAIYDEFVQEK